jgi:hypothetical protein
MLPVITSPMLHTGLSSRDGKMDQFDAAVPRTSFSFHISKQNKSYGRSICDPV